MSEHECRPETYCADCGAQCYPVERAELERDAANARADAAETLVRELKLQTVKLDAEILYLRIGQDNATAHCNNALRSLEEARAALQGIRELGGLGTAGQIARRYFEGLANLAAEPAPVDTEKT